MKWVSDREDKSVSGRYQAKEKVLFQGWKRIVDTCLAVSERPNK